MEGSDEADPALAELADLGELAAEVLCDDAGWIHRRKETIRVLDERTIRRQVSIDFEIPDQAPVWRLGVAGTKVYLLPLLLLPKAPQQLMDFDLRDEAGGALSLPSRDENGEVSAAALKAAASRLVAVGEELERYLLYIAKADPRLAAIAASALLDPGARRPRQRGVPSMPSKADREILSQDQDFPWLAERLAISSVVSVGVVEAHAPRRIIKLLYSDPVRPAGVGALELRLGWRGYQVFLDLYFLGAKTFHVEIEAPTGLELVDGASQREPPGASKCPASRGTAHVPTCT